MTLMMEKIFQVSEFNEFINLYLDEVTELVVEGEISQINVSQGKWLFATIKDDQASVEVFGVVEQISGWDILQTGMLVHVYGRPRLYQKTGRFSLSARQIVPAGAGALQIAFEKLKLKLEKAGWFDLERKRPLPVFPETIGLITAKDSRAYSDFVKVLKERMGGLQIYFYPVNVQGHEAVPTILTAFDYFNHQHQQPDLIVLARGGGSLEDLQAFNDERVAQAIFASRAPVVCGIGHEEDVSIADLVADRRASTPSNAAELIVRNRQEVLEQVAFQTREIKNQLEQLTIQANQVLLRRVGTLAAFAGQAQRQRQTIEQTKQQLVRATDTWLKQQKMRLATTARLLSNLDPHQVLKRGFSITVNQNGVILKSIKQVSNNEQVTTTLFDGKIDSPDLKINHD